MKEIAGGIIVEFKVKPDSPETRVYKKGNLFIIETQSPSENNRANMEIMEFLSKIFGEEVRILRGLKSRRKTVFIENLGKERLEKSISSR